MQRVNSKLLPAKTSAVTLCLLLCSINTRYGSHGANMAFSRVLNPLTLYLARCQIKQKPLGAAGKSVFDVRVAETQATGLFLFDMARIYASESLFRRGSLGELGGIRQNKRGVGLVPLAFKQVGLLTLQGALWETCMQVNGYKCRDVRGCSLIVSELESLFDLIRSSFHGYCRNYQTF